MDIDKAPARRQATDKGPAFAPHRSLTTEQLTEILDDEELVALLGKVGKAGVYRQFFERALCNWSVVCRCHPMRLTFPKYPLLWNECDRRHVAKYANEVLDNQQQLRDIASKLKDDDDRPYQSMDWYTVGRA